MFAAIDIASERHVLARLDDAGAAIGNPITITADRAGYDALLAALAPPPGLIVMEATGHDGNNRFAVLTAAGHDVARLHPLIARRVQAASLERTKTDATGLARRPAPTHRHDEVAEGLHELVRHRDRLRQEFEDRVRQLHRLVDLGCPEFPRDVRTLDSMLATCLLAEYPTAHAFARATPRRVAKLRDDGRHVVGPELAPSLLEAATRAVGPHHGPADKLQACHICQDLDTWRQRLAEIEYDIEDLLDTHVPGKLITSLGPQTAARISAASADPAHCKSASAFAADVGGVPGLRQSGKPTSTRAGIGPLGNARLRRALGRPVLSAVTRNAGLRAASLRLRAAGTPANVAMIAALRKLLHAAYSVAKHRRPFVTTTQGRAGEPPNNAAPRPCTM